SVLTAENLTRSKADGTTLFSQVSFQVRAQEILVIRGPSGVGKSTMLRCIAQLDELDDGWLALDNQTPEEYGIPTWRAHVAYVPQRPATLPGSPIDFYRRVCGFSAQKQRLAALRTARSSADSSAAHQAIDVGRNWNLSEGLWHTEWSRLSGGEAQRAALAIAVSLEPDVLLLDEPTSALDPDTCRLVESTLMARRGSCIWVTHDPAQAERVATRVLTL
ncbi:P-loop containing nucleoside triphosphate hydrolase protein, partial [Thamnocephalis sphaerospora]